MSIDLLLLVGYRFGDSRWKLLAEAGPAFNLSSGGRANRISGTMASPVASSYFVSRRAGLGFLGQLSGEYGLGEGRSLTAILRVQEFGGSFVNPEVGSGGSGMVSLRIGYRMRF